MTRHLLITGTGLNGTQAALHVLVTTLTDPQGAKPSLQTWPVAYLSAHKQHFDSIEQELRILPGLPASLTYRGEYTLRHVFLPVTLTALRNAAMPKEDDGSFSYCGVSYYGDDDPPNQEWLLHLMAKLGRNYGRLHIFAENQVLHQREFK